MIRHTHTHPGGTVVNNPSANSVDAKDLHSVLRFGISLGVGNDKLLHYSFLENSMESGAWWARMSPWGQKES